MSVSVEIIIGDCREVLRSLPAESVHCCVTSPPYFGLRSYLRAGHPSKRLEIGTEETPDEFIAKLVEVFREVRRVLRADGWFLRQEIIWSKPNPMPESVSDRCTKAHESLFLLSKSARYYFDQDAIAKGMVAAPPGNRSHRGAAAYDGGDEHHRTKTGLAAYADRQRRTRGLPPRHAQYPESSDQSGLDDVGRGGKRNKRSVWTVATRPFKEAHFATFPPKLIEPCILAGSPAWGTVLDPFGGSGTTAMVAQSLGREAILIDLNDEYEPMAERRVRNGDVGLPLGGVAA